MGSRGIYSMTSQQQCRPSRKFCSECGRLNEGTKFLNFTTHSINGGLIHTVCGSCRHW